MKQKYVLGTFVLAAVTGLAQAGASTTLILDDFDADPNDDAGGPGVYSSTMFSDPFSQGGVFNLDTSFDSGSDIGAVFFNSGIGAEQGASISYSNNGAGLDLDGIGLGIEGFDIDFLLSDQDFVANIVLTTFDAGGAAVGDASWAVLVSAGASTAHWSFTDFQIINGDFDASNIDDITINFNLADNPTASLDFVATEFRATVAVPAPGSLAMLGLGGLVATRRRR